MRNWIRTASIAGLAASYFVMDAANAQQAPPVLPPPATAPSVDAAASRMRAGLQLLNDERAAAENRAIQTQAELDKAQAELDKAQADLDGANARLNQEIAKNQALQKQLDGLKPKSESAPAADIPPLPAGVKPIPAP